MINPATRNESVRADPHEPVHKPVKWAAKLAGVREVSLFGTADLGYWSERLSKQDLLADGFDGQAHLMIVAAAAKYMSLPFQELSVSVLVAPPEQLVSQNAACLTGAFNSRALFALCERVFFSIPYQYGDVAVSAALPAAFTVRKDQQEMIRAEMGADLPIAQRQQLRSGEDSWEGAVYLPKLGAKAASRDKLFVARLQGDTQVYTFLPGIDSLAIRHSAGSPWLRALCDSNFVAREWVIRENALHAKSKTYNRGTWPLESGDHS